MLDRVSKLVGDQPLAASTERVVGAAAEDEVPPCCERDGVQCARRLRGLGVGVYPHL